MSEKIYKFLTMFDCQGFECLIDITKHEQLYLMSALKGTDYNSGISLNAMLLRARFNPQRSPEIWVFSSLVDNNTLQELKDEQPQALVDLIRKNGNCLWENTPVKQVIS